MSSSAWPVSASCAACSARPADAAMTRPATGWKWRERRLRPILNFRQYHVGCSRDGTSGRQLLNAFAFSKEEGPLYPGPYRYDSCRIDTIHAEKGSCSILDIGGIED